MSLRTVALDFETFYIDKDYSIKVQGQQGYINDPRFDPYLVSVCDGTETWSGHPKNFNWEAIRGARLLSHNRGFDEAVYLKMVEKGLAPSVPIHDWHCTASLTTFLCMRRDLLRATEFLLGEQVDKSYRIDADGKHYDDLVREGKLEKVLAAGRVDAVRCFQFWAKFSHLWPEMERQISDLTIRQCRRGAQIDVEKLREYKTFAQRALIQTESTLPWMAEGKKPTSPKAIAEECRKVGIPCPPVKSRDGEEAFDLWAATYSGKYRWVKAYTDYRLINKLIGILETIEGRLRTDGTFPYELFYFGAHTGRWAGSGGYNMQNMRKDPYVFDSEGRLITDYEKLKGLEKFLNEACGPEPKSRYFSDVDGWLQKRRETMTTAGFFVIDIRSLFIARPGRRLIPSDLSQIEPRVLAWIVRDMVMLKSMAGGQSPYSAHAISTMGWDGSKNLKKENKDLYALAKARVLGLGYGCGWKKFITVAQIMAGLDITKDDPEFVPVLGEDGQPMFVLNDEGQKEPKFESGYGYNSRRIVKDYRESNPLIASSDDSSPGIWKRLDTAFRDSVGGDFEITLPSGRKLRYPEVRREIKAVMDPENPGKWKRKWVTTALAFDQKRNAVVRQPFYGGLLTENLVQAASRDVFAEHCLKLDKTSGIDVLWTVHDEAVNECDIGITKDDVEQIMSHCPEWIKGLPVAAEAIEAPHYLK